MWVDVNLIEGPNNIVRNNHVLYNVIQNIELRKVIRHYQYGLMLIAWKDKTLDRGDSIVPEIQIHVPVVSGESGGDAAVLPVHVDGFMDMDGSAFRALTCATQVN